MVHPNREIRRKAKIEGKITTKKIFSPEKRVPKEN